MKKTTLFLSGLTAAALLSGCNSSSTTSVATTATDTETTHDIGYFVDSAVANVDYDCMKDNTTSTTDEDGAFSCAHMEKIRFRIGNVILGEIETLPKDGYVFPQDIAHVDRESGLTNEKVAAIIQLLQALDEDKNASNGIVIPDEKKVLLEENTPQEEEITPENVVEHANNADVSLVPKEDAVKHLEETLKHHIVETTKHNEEENNASEPERDASPTTKNPQHDEDNRTKKNLDDKKSQGEEQHNNGKKVDEEVKKHTPDAEKKESENNATKHDQEKKELAAENEEKKENGNEENKENSQPQTSTTAAALTPELKEALAHMGNEERLAYDVYTNLYNYHMKNNVEIAQLNNIAQGSETRHIARVQDLVKAYKLDAKSLDVVDANVVESHNLSSDVTQEKMPSGVYDIQAIQNLYDELYAKGQESQQAALEVGCMVEVVDVEDLDKYIKMAQESNASDIERTFDNLRSGSYNHYRSFDNALKNLGVEKGCCSLGDQWCHEYPDNRGRGRGNH